MNASDHSRDLHDTLEAMLDELGKIAQSTSATSEELYEQATDVLRLLFQPDSAAIFLFGVNGLVANAVSAPSGAERPDEIDWDQLGPSSKSNGEALVIKDESNCSHITFNLGPASERKGVLYLRTKPDGYLALQKKVVEHVGAILNRRLATEKHELPAETYRRLQKFSSSCMSSLEHDELSENLTNDIRLVLKAERAQYFKLRGKRCKLQNVSSVSRFEKRTQLLRASEALANEVFRTGKTVLSSDSPHCENVSLSLKEYKELSGFPFLACFLLRERDSLAGSDHRCKPNGVLIAEYSSRPSISDLVETSSDALPQMEIALEHAAAYSSFPLHKLWLSLHKKLNLRWFGKRMLLSAATACLLLFLCSWPVDFNIRMQGTLHAVSESNVFSPRDAFVDKVYIDHGSHVEQGQPLVALRSPELDQMLDEADGEIAKLSDLRASKKVVLNQSSTGKKADRHESIRLAGEIEELDFKIEAQQDARNFALREMEKLTVVSPIQGTVVTWNAKKLLSEKPVRWGDSLLRIADENQQWQLQFSAPEKSMGYVLDAAERNENGIHGLSVKYFFSSRPDRRYTAKILDAGKSTEMDASETLGVRVICNAAPDQNLRRHGAQVTGDIHCGKRSLAFVWTQELVDAIRRQLVW